MSMVRETDGLVPETPSPMLQPWEVYDRDLFDLEMIRVFGRSWVWLGDTEDLQNPGDFLTGRIGAQSVLVVRTADGEIKGFLNNCRHRASGLLFEPAGNCGSSMTCPYHNWAYDLDGRLIGIPDKARMYPDGRRHDATRAGADPHRGGVGQARVRLPVAQGAVVQRVDRSARRPLRHATSSTPTRATTATSTRSTRSTGRRSPRTRTTTTTCGSCTAA